MKSKIFIVAAIGGLLLTSGCANVQPWERGNLTEPTMQADLNPLAATQSKHIWFSREQATGGGSVGGGGCGCN